MSDVASSRNSDWLTFREWAEDIDKLIPADQIVVPSFGENSLEYALRVKNYVDAFLRANGRLGEVT
jgi:hypothetical protein